MEVKAKLVLLLMYGLEALAKLEVTVGLLSSGTSLGHGHAAKQGSPLWTHACVSWHIRGT
jgi:hypothetical protein